MKSIVRRTGRGAESSFTDFAAKTPPSALASCVKRVPDDVAFAGQAKFIKKIDTSRAGAVLVPPEATSEMINLVRVENPQLAFIKVLSLHFPYFSRNPLCSIFPVGVLGIL